MNAIASLVSVLVALLLAFGDGTPACASEGHGGAPPAGEAHAEPKKPAKPKPKRPDKEKNCQWVRDIDLEIDGKHLTINQASLKNAMRGAESQQDGYEIFANPDRLELRVRAPGGEWYVASMTRLGDMNEGCVFYFIGEAKQVDTEPPLN